MRLASSAPVAVKEVRTPEALSDPAKAHEANFTGPRPPWMVKVAPAPRMLPTVSEGFSAPLPAVSRSLPISITALAFTSLSLSDLTEPPICKVSSSSAKPSPSATPGPRTIEPRLSPWLAVKMRPTVVVWPLPETETLKLLFVVVPERASDCRSAWLPAMPSSVATALPGPLNFTVTLSPEASVKM